MRHRNRAFAAAVLTIVAIALVGCTANPVAAKVVPSTKSVVAPSRTVAPSPSAPTPAGALSIHAAKAKTLAIGCSTLVPDSAVATFDTGFATAADYTPATGSVAAQIVAANGTACEWENAKSSSTLQVAVAHPGASDALMLKNTLVDTSNSVPTYGEEAYFRTSAGVGEVDAFHGKYWIVAISADFYEPGDASPIIAAVDEELDKQ